jgi:hypothetical protein
VRGIPCLVVVVVFVLTLPARAETGDRSWPKAWAESAGLAGSVRAAYWSSSRELDDREHFVTAALWLGIAPEILDGMRFFANGWLGTEDLLGEHELEGRLREAYVKLTAGALDLRLGKQIIAWGRADGINPTDNLCPRDFTLLVTDDADQVEGSVAARLTAYWGRVSVTGIWLPLFEPHVVPLGPPPPGVTVRERVPQGAVGGWATKLEQAGGKIDWSLSYYDGFDRFPDLGVDRVTATAVDAVLKYHNVRIVGVDAATTLGSYGLRGEAAYTFTENSSGRRFDIKRPFLFVVVGGDRLVAPELNVNVQYLFRWIFQYRSPRQIDDPVTQAIAFEQALETEISAVVWFTRTNAMIRPKTTYAITDRWRLVIGADIFAGPERSPFGRLARNTTVYSELRFTF